MHALDGSSTTERNQLAIKYFPLVRATAVKIHRRLPEQVELDDLISVGMMGLIEAIDRFDTSRSVPLGTYARHRIRGAIVDALRGADWVPRSVREKMEKVERTRRGLNQFLGRPPTRAEMARRLDLTEEAYDKLVDSVRLRTVVSLDAPVGDESGSYLVERLPSKEDPNETALNMERRRHVAEALEYLPGKEGEAVSLYYFHDLPLREVGEVLGVSESRACQLCAKGISRLRSHLVRLAA